MTHYWDKECECDWCQWECEMAYSPLGGTIGSLLLALLIREETS